MIQETRFHIKIVGEHSIYYKTNYFIFVATFGLLKSTIWRTFAIQFFQMYVLSPEKRRVSNGREMSDDFLPAKSQTFKKNVQPLPI